MAYIAREVSRLNKGLIAAVGAPRGRSSALRHTMTTKDIPRLKLDLPAVPHKLLNDNLEVVFKFYREHLRRDVDAGRLTPADPWVMVHGFLIAAMQTYASICILLADNRPKRLMLQAGVLNRSLFEIMATVVALTEDLVPRAQILVRESYKDHARRHELWTKRFSSDPKWTQHLAVSREFLTTMPEKIGLPAELAQKPAAIPDEWPTPGVMVYGRSRGKVRPFVSGSRRAVLKEIHESYYAELSAQAHGRMASVALAMLVDDPALQWNPGYGESEIITSALLFLACILSEIEHAGGYAHHRKLAELWTYLRELHDEAKELWRLRYEELSTSSKRA